MHMHLHLQSQPRIRVAAAAAPGTTNGPRQIQARPLRSADDALLIKSVEGNFDNLVSLVSLLANGNGTGIRAGNPRVAPSRESSARTHP